MNVLSFALVQSWCARSTQQAWSLAFAKPFRSPIGEQRCFARSIIIDDAVEVLRGLHGSPVTGHAQ